MCSRKQVNYKWHENLTYSDVCICWKMLFMLTPNTVQKATSRTVQCIDEFCPVAGDNIKIKCFKYLQE